MKRFPWILPILFLAATASAQPVNVQLEVTPATTLPGIPVSVRVTFTNKGAKPVALPAAGVLLVTPQTGAQFPARWESSPVVWFEGEEKVAGNAPVVREFSADGSLGTPAWFFNDQFTTPGKYQLQMYVADFQGIEADYRKYVQRATAVSNAVVLTVAEPRGEDAIVWKALLAHASPNGWLANDVSSTGGAELVQQLVREHPESQYAAWLITTGTDAGALSQWLDQHPNDPYFEWRTLRVAQWEVSLALKHASANPAKSKAHEKKAREALDKLQKARDAEVRKLVKENLESLAELTDG